jgi:ATP-dependent Clp protease ATP-binding subunit ClpC
MGPLDPNALRLRQARLSKTIGKNGALLLAVSSIAVILVGNWLAIFQGQQVALLLLPPAIIAGMIALWWYMELSKLIPTGQSLAERLDREVLIRLPKRLDTLQPQSLWQALSSHWQINFFANHLYIAPDAIGQLLSQNPSDLLFVWDKALELANSGNSVAIEPGHIAGALLLTSQPLVEALKQLKLGAGDVQALVGWLSRSLEAMHRPKPSFGGIGRDWANGFTPRLNQFGHNISQEIEQHGAHFGSMVESPGVLAIKAAFSQGAAAIALVGDEGIGKTSYGYALAQNLLAETADRNLEHRQIVALSPSTIIGAAKQPGDLEYIVNMLLNETAHAGHIILFFDDAQLFFKDGAGSFNATQLLLPAVQSRVMQAVFAMTPHDYQQLKAENPAFAGLLTPVMLQEPDELAIIQSLEDAATRFEIRHRVLITYEALKEAYRLSGRYDQEMAYPGKAIRLLEQSLTHASNNVVNAASVQAAIEQAHGVKVGSAAPAESDALLQLEDTIHQRMINQSRAVSVVSNALRRARAGVANPKRPIGSFLFLGPTGVGKTELAKAIAATYFGSEASMIRLDMSEYQQESDVSRILSGGETETSSLILKVRQQPFSVVLLDEIEKAHPNILNLLLQLLDEGQLTDTNGRPASFKDAVIIATSNAGADVIRQRIERGEELESFEREFTDQLITSGQFRPELLNRFDEIVLFRPLKADELAQVVQLMLAEVNRTLATQNISVQLTPAAIAKIVAVGNDPRLGARPMRRALQRAVEDTIAQKILRQEVHPGDQVTLDAPDLTV